MKASRTSATRARAGQGRVYPDRAFRRLGGGQLRALGVWQYLRIVIRDLDNSRVNALVNRYRTLHGNVTMDNRDFARGLISAVRTGETVGILMDTNMTPPQGIFVDYFGTAAATASGLAKIALRTGAAVVPGFTIWEMGWANTRSSSTRRCTLVRTGDDEADAIANTALFTRKIEEYARRYPEQWLWVHRRWKTRPAGEPGSRTEMEGDEASELARRLGAEHQRHGCRSVARLLDERGDHRQHRICPYAGGALAGARRAPRER